MMGHSRSEDPHHYQSLSVRGLYHPPPQPPPYRSGGSSRYTEPDANPTAQQGSSSGSGYLAPVNGGSSGYLEPVAQQDSLSGYLAPINGQAEQPATEQLDETSESDFEYDYAYASRA